MAEPRATAGIITIERTLAAPPEVVYAAWTTPASMAVWLTPVGHAEVDADVRVGGAFTITMVGDGRRIEHSGEYLELVPPHLLRFTWRSPYTGPEPGVVTVELRPAPGGTALRLTHASLPSEAVDGHRGGWGSMLERLGAELAESI